MPTNFLTSMMSDIRSRSLVSPYSADSEIRDWSGSGSSWADTRPSNPAASHSSSAVWGVTGIMAWIQILSAAEIASLLHPPRLAYQRMSLSMSK